MPTGGERGANHGGLPRRRECSSTPADNSLPRVPPHLAAHRLPADQVFERLLGNLACGSTTAGVRGGLNRRKARESVSKWGPARAGLPWREQAGAAAWRRQVDPPQATSCPSLSMVWSHSGASTPKKRTRTLPFTCGQWRAAQNASPESCQPPSPPRQAVDCWMGDLGLWRSSRAWPLETSHKGRQAWVQPLHSTCACKVQVHTSIVSPSSTRAFPWMTSIGAPTCRCGTIAALSHSDCDWCDWLAAHSCAWAHSPFWPGPFPKLTVTDSASKGCRSPLSLARIRSTARANFELTEQRIVAIEAHVCRAAVVIDDRKYRAGHPN